VTEYTKEEWARVAAKRDPAVETNLGAMLRCFMAMERWSMRKLAPEIGISSATLFRVYKGLAMDADTFMKVLNWLMRSPRRVEIDGENIEREA
jgi:hypothetical protein